MDFKKLDKSFLNIIYNVVWKRMRHDAERTILIIT